MLDLVLTLCLVVIFFGVMSMSALALITLGELYVRRNPIGARRLVRRLNKILGV